MWNLRCNSTVRIPCDIAMTMRKRRGKMRVGLAIMVGLMTLRKTVKLVYMNVAVET